MSASTKPACAIWLRLTLCVCTITAVLTSSAASQVNVVTNRYDGARTGANLAETALTTANVNRVRFGKLFSYPVDGSVYAQPLYASGVNVGGRLRNVLYVATMNDRVYAFDADSSSPTPLWTRNFTNPPAVTAVPITDIVAADLNVTGNVGIQSTPVIDRATATIYLVARTKEGSHYVQRLHALDIATGESRAGSPVEIAGSVPGSALDATSSPTGPVITFDPGVHIQRAGLALSNGVVLVAWASHEDVTPSHGWIMAFDATTLHRVGIVAVAPDGYLGGVWQGGRAPTIDAAGNAYFSTGNGLWDGRRNFGNSLLKYSVGPTGLRLLDYFTPYNVENLNLADDDLSGSGFTLLPGTSLLLGGGKEGVLYLLDANRLGGKTADDRQVPQKLRLGGGHVMGGPVYWNSAATGPLVYNWSEDDVLKAYKLSSGRLTTTPYLQGTVMSPGHPGGSLTVSANGSSAGSGILWAAIPTSRDAKHGLAPGMLRAFNADTLQEIWTSEQNAARDRVGTLMKFVPPLIAKGRVYIPNHDNQVAVYGLMPAGFSVSAAPAAVTITAGASATVAVNVTSQGGFADRVDLRATGYPAGTTVTFSPQSVTGSGGATMTITPPAAAAAGSFTIAISATSGTVTRSASVGVQVLRPTSAGSAIGIDFAGGSALGMSAGESAGVVPQAYWNHAAGAARSTPLPLVDAAGRPSTATITWAAAGVYSTPITDSAGNARMMKGYLDTTSTSTTRLAVTGLAPATYDVYLYIDGANGSATRTGTYTLSGPGATSHSATMTDRGGVNFGTTFIAGNNAAGNYIRFRVTGSAFNVTAMPLSGSTTTLRAPLNGLQIAPVPAARVPAQIGVSFAGAHLIAVAPGERAGVVPQANWNNASGAVRSTALSLVDAAGTATGASLTWAAAGTWATPITDAPGNARLMKGYLDTTSTSTTQVTVTGLADAAYDVYVYVDGANGSYTRTGAYTISGPGLTPSTVELTDLGRVNFGGTFIVGNDGSGNYIRFPIAGTGFTLTAVPVSGTNTTLRAPVSGFQIVPR